MLKIANNSLYLIANQQAGAPEASLFHSASYFHYNHVICIHKLKSNRNGSDDNGDNYDG